MPLLFIMPYRFMTLSSQCFYDIEAGRYRHMPRAYSMVYTPFAQEGFMTGQAVNEATIDAIYVPVAALRDAQSGRRLPTDYLTMRAVMMK